MLGSMYFNYNLFLYIYLLTNIIIHLFNWYLLGIYYMTDTLARYYRWQRSFSHLNDGIKWKDTHLKQTFVLYVKCYIQTCLISNFLFLTKSISYCSNHVLSSKALSSLSYSYDSFCSYYYFILELSFIYCFPVHILCVLWGQFRAFLLTKSSITPTALIAPWVFPLAYRVWAF